MIPVSNRVSVRSVPRAALRVLLAAWAGFWGWFVLAVSYGGAEAAPPWWIPAAGLGVLAVLVVLGWKRPLAGGIALVAVGLAAAAFFPNPAARALLAAPAVLLGLGCIALSRHERRFAGAALLLLAISFAGCSTPQDPADLPYRTSSILRHASGALQRAALVEPAEISGYPCQGWLWWHADGSFDNLELSRDHVVQGHAFAAGTRVFFDAEGRLAHAWLEQDAQVDGLPCRGRWKIDTAFHPNGHVKAFFPPRDFEIDGVLCEASVFHPIYLHPDGRLRQCKLARDAEIDGRPRAKGDVVTLDATTPATHW
jgi:hypothetical protein